MDLTTYRSLLRDSRARRLLAGLAVSSLGDDEHRHHRLARAGDRAIRPRRRVCGPGGGGVLAARGTVVIVSAPLGIALGGPLVSLLGGGGTLFASGLATVLLAAVALLVWPREPESDRHEAPVPSMPRLRRPDRDLANPRHRRHGWPAREQSSLVSAERSRL
jgi:hypothetical protein